MPTEFKMIYNKLFVEIIQKSFKQEVGHSFKQRKMFELIYKNVRVTEYLKNYYRQIQEV